MAHEAYWDDQIPDLYIIKFLETWTWQEFQQAIASSYEYLKNEQRTLDVVVGFYNQFPLGSAVLHLTFAGEQPSNIRHTVMINETNINTQQFVETLISSVDRMKGWHGPTFVEDVEQARKTIQKMRANV